MRLLSSYVTENGTDTITHRIDQTYPGGNATILFGDFQVQHDLEAFRKQFEVPQQCQKNNLLQCPSSTVEYERQLADKHRAGR